jgi:hypothetical protein
MSTVVLVLGPVAFQDFEIPSGINFGGRQLLAIHQLTDGRRVVDSIGADESEISFSGAFSGTDATLRARTLNSLRVAGDELSLTWDVFFYTVVLSRLDADYQNPVWIPYRISCTVVQDEGAAPISSVISLGNSILADLSVACDHCAGLGIDFTNVQSLLANSGAVTLGSTAYTAAQSSINLTQSAINNQIISTESALQASTLFTPSTVGSLVTDLMASTTSTQQLADLVSAKAYVGRAARNLANAST